MNRNRNMKYKPYTRRKLVMAGLVAALAIVFCQSLVVHYHQQADSWNALVKREKTQAINEWYRPVEAQTPEFTTWVCKPTTNQGDSCSSGGAPFVTARGSHKRPWDDRMSMLAHNNSAPVDAFFTALFSPIHLLIYVILMVMMVRYRRGTKLMKAQMNGPGVHTIIDLQLPVRGSGRSRRHVRC